MASAELMDPVKGVLIVCHDPNTNHHPGERQTLSVVLAVVLIMNAIAMTTGRAERKRMFVWSLLVCAYTVHNMCLP